MGGKTLTERIGRLEGRTTYKDFRDGMASSGFSLMEGVSDSDIAGALGSIRRKLANGRVDITDIAPEAMQTYYGSTRLFEDGLMEAYLESRSASERLSRARSIRERKATRRESLHAAYLERNPEKRADTVLLPTTSPERAHRLVIERVAASIAASRLSGASEYGTAQWVQMAWFCCCGVKDLQQVTADAIGWFMDIVHEATPRFLRQLEDAEKAA